ncbi:MAG: hypothetical protein ABTD50_02715 [Polyangiaceae bacterium]|jgi:hypothetical protein
MGEAILAGALVLSLALWVTAHVTLVAGLAARVSVRRALLALAAAPLAPIWGYRHGMRVRAAIWAVSAAAYAILRWLAER